MGSDDHIEDIGRGYLTPVSNHKKFVVIVIVPLGVPVAVLPQLLSNLPSSWPSLTTHYYCR